MFNCSVRDAVHRRKIKFLNKLQHPDNISCKLFSDNISHELTSLIAILPYFYTTSSCLCSVLVNFTAMSFQHIKTETLVISCWKCSLVTEAFSYASEQIQARLNIHGMQTFSLFFIKLSGKYQNIGTHNLRAIIRPLQKLLKYSSLLDRVSMHSGKSRKVVEFKNRILGLESQQKWMWSWKKSGIPPIGHWIF